MPGSTADLGTYPWTARTEGHLTRADKRALLAPLLRAHAVNSVGRLAMATHLNSGRRAAVEPDALVPPESALTRAAEECARRQLPAVLLNHSYRTYTFGAALGALEDLDVDHELLFAAAMLHDIGLAAAPRSADFTLRSARAARDVAEAVGLSSAATDTVRTAITLHHSPGVALDHGPVAYLLSAGASPARDHGSAAARLQARVRPALARRGRRRPCRSSELPAPLRRLRCRDPARPVPGLTEPRLWVPRSGTPPGCESPPERSTQETCTCAISG